MWIFFLSLNYRVCEICKSVAANVEGDFDFKGLSRRCLFFIYLIAIVLFCLVLFFVLFYFRKGVF